jgi:hypothetical protein
VAVHFLAYETQSAANRPFHGSATQRSAADSCDTAAESMIETIAKNLISL